MTFWIHAAVHVARALSDHHKKAAAPTTTTRHQPRRTASTTGERILFLDAKWAPMEGAREVRLGARGGQAWLLLCDPEPDASADGWSDAVIEARDPGKGARFVGAVAGWLDVVPPKHRRASAAPPPFALRWSRVDEVHGVERIALAFAWNGRAAEIFLHVRGGAPMVRLVEKDPSMRADLVAILAIALRDGAPA